MFTSSRTLLFKDHEATASNLKLLLESERTSLFGDPYFGTLLKRIIFEQNSSILRDIVIDEIYTSIITFIPQLKLTRNDIDVETDGVDVYVVVSGLNLIDFQNDMLKINLTSINEVE